MNINTRDLSTSGPAESVKEMEFSVSHNEADEEFAMEVMSSQLYSDKLKIIAQEYISNSRDAHREAGNPTARVKVHLPSEKEPWYEVADEGNGMSPELFEKVFMKYFASTKRGESATAKRSTGGFGLGAKSAWSYTPEFFVNTINDGVEYCYHCYRNEKKKRVAALTSQSRIGAGEHSGTTIRVNIKKEDISAFNSRYNDITRMWSIKPIVVNASEVALNYSFPEDAIIIETPEFTVFRHNRGMRNASTALVDEIPYPLDYTIFADALTPSELKFVKNGVIYFKCARDGVDPTPNRENLEYNAHTTEYLIRCVKDAHAHVANLIQTKVDSAGSYWNALILWQSAELSDFHNIFGDVFYNGIKLFNSNINYENRYGTRKDKTIVMEVSFRTEGDGAIKSVWNECSSHKPMPCHVLVFQNGGDPRKASEKLVQLYKNIMAAEPTREKLYLLVVRLAADDGVRTTEVNRLEKEYNWSRIDKYNLADVVAPKAAVKKRRAATGAIGDVYKGVGSNDLIRATVDMRGRHDVYVPIKNKTVTILGKEFKFDSFEVKYLMQMFTKIDWKQVNLYGVPVRNIKKMAKFKTMRTLDSVITAHVDGMRNTHNFNDVVSKSKASSDVRALAYLGYTAGGVISSLLSDGLLSKDSLVGKYYSINKNSGSARLTTDETNIIWYLRSFGGYSEENVVDTPEVVEMKRVISLYKEHMAPVIDMFNSTGNPAQRKHMAAYINMVEKDISNPV